MRLINVGSTAALSSIYLATATQYRFCKRFPVFWYEFSIDSLHTQNLNQNVLTPSVRDVEIFRYLLEVNWTIFKRYFFNFIDFNFIYSNAWKTGMRQVFNDFSIFFSNFDVTFQR